MPSVLVMDLCEVRVPSSRARSTSVEGLSIWTKSNEVHVGLVSLVIVELGFEKAADLVSRPSRLLRRFTGILKVTTAKGWAGVI